MGLSSKQTKGLETLTALLLGNGRRHGNRPTQADRRLSEI